MAVSTHDHRTLMQQLSQKNPNIPSDVIQDCLIKSNYDVERCAQNLQRLNPHFPASPRNYDQGNDLRIHVDPGVSLSSHNRYRRDILREPQTLHHRLSREEDSTSRNPDFHSRADNGDMMQRSNYDSGAWISMQPQKQNRYVSVTSIYPSPSTPSSGGMTPDPSSMVTQPFGVPQQRLSDYGGQFLSGQYRGGNDGQHQSNSEWEIVNPTQQPPLNIRIPSPVPPYVASGGFSPHRDFQSLPPSTQSTRGVSSSPSDNKQNSTNFKGLHVHIPQNRTVNPSMPKYQYPIVMPERTESPTSVTVISGISGSGKTVTKIRSFDAELPQSETNSQDQLTYGYHSDSEAITPGSQVHKKSGGFQISESPTTPVVRSPIRDFSIGIIASGQDNGNGATLSPSAKADLNEKLNDEAYIQALLTHQKGRYDRLKKKYAEEKSATERERQSVKELERDLFEKKSLRSPFPSSEQISRLREEKQKLQIDNEVMQAEITKLKNQVFGPRPPPPYPGGFYGNLDPGPSGPLPPPQDPPGRTHPSGHNPMAIAGHPHIPTQPTTTEEGQSWNCGMCTYRNHADLQTCEMCGVPRQSTPSLNFSLSPH